MDASQLRRAFTGFFTERGHQLIPSSGLIPHHPAAPLFTVAGMVQFIPYFLGEEPAPWPRATSVQKCVRTVDIDIVGTTTRHVTFFEMLGNFSFGDYFKDVAIPYAWTFATEVLGLEPDRLWVTAHTSDDEAADLWRDAAGVRPERIQRLGDDNWWEMAKGGTGPCGPCAEMYFDKGPEFGAEGGPAHGGEERYVEFWNLVFMQYNRRRDGELEDLPRKNIDTGAGLDRILPILQGKGSVFDADVLRPMIDVAEQLTGRRYGDDPDVDVALRILADHGRSMTFLVGDDVVPSNDDRGYVVRRIIRRAVRHAYQLGVERPVTPALVDATVEVMGAAYPNLVADRDRILETIDREEQRFRQTLRTGMTVLEEKLIHAGEDAPVLAGADAFLLHDTFGFPLELTREIAAERGVDVDVEGFETAMAEQRRRAKDARRAGTDAGVDADDADSLAREYQRLLTEHGPTEFTGYSEYESKATVLAVLGDELFLDRTPFYAEGGGQVGDTGTITTSTGTVEVLDTTYARAGLTRHKVRVVEGEVAFGQEALASIDTERREAIRRNHTGTHMLHWALREVLGSHVKQAGSLVAPDRLRFDFSHHSPVSSDELARVEALANERVLADEPVRAYETTMDEAQRAGAIAFFGDKYGDVVRVVEAGGRSMELCGGTHVSALGMIGPIHIVSEASIGSNLRRLEALTGERSLQLAREHERLLAEAASLLKVKPDELPARLEQALEERRALQREVEALRRQAAGSHAADLAATAVDGVVVARRDGGTRDELRDLAVAVRDQPGIRAVVLGGAPDGGGVALVAAVTKDSGLVASQLIADAAKAVGGGGGKAPDLAVAGGRDPSRLDEALDLARRAAGLSAA